MTSSQIINALRRRWLASAIVFLAVVAVFVVVALGRTPTYTAQARLNVGQGSIAAQSIPNYATGIQSLASTYSRAIVASVVTRSVGTKLGLSTDEVEDRLSASPIPESSLILVEGTGPSERDATRLANEGSKQLIEYVDATDRASRRTEGVLAEFADASQALSRAESRRETLVRRDASVVERARATGDVARARLRSQSLSDLYRTNLEQSESGDLVRVLTSARTATSDRSSSLQRLIGTGVLAGAVFAVLVALLPLRRRRPSTS